MKKALIVANLAGFASFLINDMKLLQNLGYEVVFAANANKLQWDDTRKKLDDLGVEFKQIDLDSSNPFKKTNIAAYKQIKSLLKENQFDVIHCHTPIAGIITRLAARKYRKKGAKVIYTTHGFAFNENASKKSWLIYYNIEKFCSRFCDSIITINYEDYGNAKKMHCKQVYRINGVGVNIDKYRSVSIDRDEYRKKLGVEPDQTMVLGVGELSVRKNHRIIIEAIATIPEKEKYVFVVCGNGINGGTGEMLKALANEKNVNLKLLGFRFDIPEIIASSDIGVIPSIREGLGLAGVQSLAGGVPVIGSAVQGIKDYVIDGETGYLCSPNDADAFAKRIIQLTDRQLCESMRESCIAKAKEFSTDVSFAQMEQIYQQIIG